MLGLKTFTSQHLYSGRMCSTGTKKKIQKKTMRQEAREMSDEAGLPGGRWKVTPEWQLCCWWGGQLNHVACHHQDPHFHQVTFFTWGQNAQENWPRFSSVLALSWPCVRRVSPLRHCWGHTHHSQGFSAFPREQEVDRGGLRSREDRAATLTDPASAACPAPGWHLSLWRALFLKPIGGFACKFPRKGLVTSRRNGSQSVPQDCSALLPWEPLPSAGSAALPAWLVRACPLTSRLGSTSVCI